MTNVVETEMMARPVTASRRSRFTIPWPHDGARELEIVIDADVPQFGPMQKRIRGIAGIADSSGALRVLLESAFADLWSVGMIAPVDGVTTVSLAPLKKISAQATSRHQERTPKSP